ncbi:MAG: lytic transglycosylase [Pseudomonadota bacterium]|uniref:transglycosylase SLT domain-containing protein n=1 Tax=Roseovarius TaxID=74030 RepID=UPI0022A89C9C|nr:lytic transglycosylase [Roseovarius sp. EGI FJ00037]MCZ0813674.1 lytic transglycosylase [Roseovarius sp. EGI FJ00037]
MSRTLRAFLIVLLVASCGGGPSGPPPSNLDNACSILEQRPQYKRAFNAAERRWGVPVHVQMATIHQESSFDGNARTPFRWTLGIIPMGRQSSAYGYSQALDGTWDEYKRETRRFGARRNDISDATDFMGWYMSKSNQSLGIPLSDTRNQYLAYHEGRTGFARRSFNSKPWLLRVADKVDSRSQMYQAQLRRCNGRGFGLF